MQNVDFSQNTCFKEHSSMAAVIPNFWVRINLYNVFRLSHGIKIVLRSRLYQWYTHLRKTFLKLLFLKVCKTFLFRQSKKVCSIFGSTLAFFAFLEKRKPNRYCLLEENLVFHLQIFSLMCQSVNLSWKIAVRESRLCFHLFL